MKARIEIEIEIEICLPDVQMAQAGELSGTVLVFGPHMELASDMGPGKDILKFTKKFDLQNIHTFNCNNSREILLIALNTHFSSFFSL